jgi:hypothetical protein
LAEGEASAKTSALANVVIYASTMVMKAGDFKDAQDIIDDMKMGKLDRRALTALLIYIREHLPHDMIKDLAHCVAHSDPIPRVSG